MRFLENFLLTDSSWSVTLTVPSLTLAVILYKRMVHFYCPILYIHLLLSVLSLSLSCKDGSCNGLQHYAALGRDKVKSFSNCWDLRKVQYIQVALWSCFLLCMELGSMVQTAFRTVDFICKLLYMKLMIFLALNLKVWNFH